MLLEREDVAPNIADKDGRTLDLTSRTSLTHTPEEQYMGALKRRLEGQGSILQSVDGNSSIGSFPAELSEPSKRPSKRIRRSWHSRQMPAIRQFFPLGLLNCCAAKIRPQFILSGCPDLVCFTSPHPCYLPTNRHASYILLHLPKHHMYSIDLYSVCFFSAPHELVVSFSFSLALFFIEYIPAPIFNYIWYFMRMGFVQIK